MAPANGVASRRSERISRGLPVFVCGESPKRKPFREEAMTVAFNAHGALLVVYLTPSYRGLTHVGVEFVHPAPEFWPVSNPPDDWSVAPSLQETQAF
jgi:hypothetical protein